MFVYHQVLLSNNTIVGQRKQDSGAGSVSLFLASVFDTISLMSKLSGKSTGDHDNHSDGDQRILDVIR